MIAIKPPADASENPYRLLRIFVENGTHVSKGEPLFVLIQTSTNRQVTLCAPIDGILKERCITSSDLLNEPGRHMAIMERSTPSPEQVAEPITQQSYAIGDPDYIVRLSYDASLFPVQIRKWLVAPGDVVFINQHVAELILADGRQMNLTTGSGGRVKSLAVAAGGYITQMAPSACIIEHVDAAVARDGVPVTMSTTMQNITAATESNQMQDHALTESIGTAQEESEKVGSNDPPSRLVWGLFIFGFFCLPGLAILYAGVGSRFILGAAALGLFVLICIIARKSATRYGAAAVLVVFCGVIMLAPQEGKILHPQTTPWEPFGLATLFGDGDRHGSFWENMNRPTPSKQEQREFDKWLDG